MGWDGYPILLWHQEHRSRAMLITLVFVSWDLYWTYFKTSLTFSTAVLLAFIHWPFALSSLLPPVWCTPLPLKIPPLHPPSTPTQGKMFLAWKRQKMLRNFSWETWAMYIPFFLLHSSYRKFAHLTFFVIFCHFPWHYYDICLWKQQFLDNRPNFCSRCSSSPPHLIGQSSLSS